MLEPEPLVLEVVIELGTPCGSNEGQLEIDIQGGTSPYDIVWSNGGTTPAIGQLAAGHYEVVVEDEQGCTASDAFVVECDAVLDLLPFEFISPDGDGSNDTWVMTMLSIIQICRFVFTIDGARWSLNTRVPI